MSFLRSIDAVLEKIEKALVVLLFSSLILLVGINIAARNLFQSSVRHIFDIAPGLVLWLALLGSSLALKQGRHIKMELFLRFLPARARRIAAVSGSIFGAAVMGVLAVSSLSFLKNEIAVFGARGYAAVIFPIFFFLAAFRFLLCAVLPEAGPSADRRSSEDAGFERNGLGT